MTIKMTSKVSGSLLMSRALRVLNTRLEFRIFCLDSDRTLLGPSNEYNKLQEFHDYFNN